MTSHGTINAAMKAITRINALSAQIVDSSRYWNTSAGRTLNEYVQTRGRAALLRQVGRLRAQIGKARHFSDSLRDEPGPIIRAICDATEAVIECCRYFPREEEWPGQKPLNKQRQLIARARSLLAQGRRHA